MESMGGRFHMEPAQGQLIAEEEQEGLPVVRLHLQRRLQLLCRILKFAQAKLCQS